MTFPLSDSDTSQIIPTMTSSIDKMIVLNEGSQLYIKLDGENYPAWRIQFIVSLTGYDLMGYVDGINECP